MLSSEIYESRIEKESSTVLLFDNDNEGNVIIQGSDEMCVLGALTLFEEIICKASVNVASFPEGGKKMVSQDENSGGIIVKRKEICSYASENDMELDIIDLESDTGDVAINVMMSSEPEIKRLIKCGREIQHTDDEIQEVLQKFSKVPKASDFIRALHTCQNLKAISDTESNTAPLGANITPAVKAKIGYAAQKFDAEERMEKVEASQQRNHMLSIEQSAAFHNIALGKSPTVPIVSQLLGKLGNIHLRYVVIDGSNVAMTHGNGKCFSCRGIQIAVEHFRRRGHKEITVFVPQWRRQVPKFGEIPIKDQHILEDLGKNGILTFTPSRRLRGGKTKNIVCCGDRFILRLAAETDGVVVSNDNYHDLYLQKPEWSKVIETRFFILF